MASTSEDSRSPSLNSYETALCIIPPTPLTHDVNRLRALYDKAYEKWPPHINLIYPFVAPESLPHAVDVVRNTLVENSTEEFSVRLDKADFFAHKRSNTIYVTDSGDGCKTLQSIRKQILLALEQADAPFQPHLTIGQSDANDDSVRDYLVSKTSLLPPVDWQVSELTVLIRDRSVVSSTAIGQMRVWGTIKLLDDYEVAFSDITPLSKDLQGSAEGVQKGVTYYFEPAETSNTKGAWKALELSAASDQPKLTKSSISVASYNVLIDSMHPPPTERYPILVKNLLADSSTADILVLQEVADDFLSYLLRNDQIHAQYPFSTHGPPEQPEIGPLPSLRNVVVLSRWRFRWEWLPFEKRHKGSVVLQLEDIGLFRENQFLPLIVTGVHLTCGLTDGSIAAKHSQVKTIIRHLKSHYRDHHWIIAGDFNITTSSYTIDAALKRNAITAHGASILSSLEVLFSESGLVDCYFANRVTGTTSSQRSDEFVTLHEGEEGATYDPTENTLAADISGRSYHSRPQRYDRIFVKGDAFKVTDFNLFGLPDANAAEYLGSDHWGIRAETYLDLTSETEVQELTFNVERTPQSLGTGTQLKALLDDHEMFPTEDELAHRQMMFELIKRMVQQKDINTAVETRLNICFAVAPVGSYRLGVWDTSSDIDCLVIGTISPRTFFALIIQRLRRPEWQEIHMLRKVKAASGTMLELEAGRVRLDLQYCAATSVAER
jgi:2'-5' RNA ligase/endonuclease/exonuclease/phosphatase family metal-dependent hydrolase